VSEDSKYGDLKLESVLTPESHSVLLARREILLVQKTWLSIMSWIVI